MTQLYRSRPAALQQSVIIPGGGRLRRFAALLVTSLGLASAAHGQSARSAPTFFQADAAARTAASAAPLAATLARSQALTLDAPGLRAALATAPLEGRAGAAPLVLALPRPDGRSAHFALREVPIMEAPLAARYPQIKTYAGVGLDDATATVRLDLTPQGFHAQVLSGDGPGFLIAPVSPTDTRHYLIYNEKDVPAASKAAQCRAVATLAQQQASAARVAAWRGAGGHGPAARLSGAQLRTYRFALTSTPDFSADCGNTRADVLAVLATFTNQMNGLFERDLAVRLVLVANNDQLIFLSGTGPQPPFPYTGNLTQQNQRNVDQLIGDANYDLGLVLIREGGGGALVGGLGTSGFKAINIAGHPVPGDYQLVRYAAHEVGHILGATHTFNAVDVNNRSGTTAWEPGAGVTLMSYCGSYGPDNNVQRQTETFFHTGSYEQIQAVMSARTCGTLTATGNAVPVVTAPAGGKTLPLNTPFRLTATATDADNDPLTYSWEELDTGPAGNLTMPQVAGETPPLFRIFPPTTSPTRYFPRLADLANPAPATAPATGERLPTVARTLRFRCTARDLHSGPLGVVGGVDYSALVSLSVSAAAGPFVVTALNAAGTSWAGGSTQTVTWDVANTNAAPVSCAKVNLRLSLDGGLSYPLELASNVANSGSASISVPNAPTAMARIMVEAADNYFFDISNADFAITPGPGPVISSFTPARGPVGTVVTLTGLNFTGATVVAINGTAATNVTVVSATSLTATVGTGSTSGLITVTTPAGTGTSATPFLVGSPPTITSFTPTSGPLFTDVTVTGTNFLGTTQVQVSGRAANFYVVSDTQLTLTVPDYISAGPLTVTTPLGTVTSTGVFTVSPRPVINSFAPAQGPEGTTVVLSGNLFTGATQVRFGGISALAFTVNSATRLTATVPPGAITGPVSVATPAGLGVSGNSFTVVPPPLLTGISPASGVVGMTVTLMGSTLDQVTALTLNGVAVPGFVLVNATTITFVVPAGATTGVVLGTANGGGGGSSVRFTVLTPAPSVVIGGIVPTQGITGATIRLTGTGFTGATLVSFSGSSPNAVSSGFAVNAAGTELTGLVVPNGAATGVLTVTTPAGTSAASAQVFTVCALPAAQAQNAQIALNAGGTATLAPTAVNNGSSANCGVAAASTLSVAPNIFTTADLGPAVVASALRLNGSGQYVAIGGSSTVPIHNSSYTIEAWVKPATMGGNSIIGWGYFGFSNAVNALRLSATGLVNYWWGNDLEVPTPSLVGAWHHVAATFDGTTRTLYLDGVAVGSDQPGGGHDVFNAQNLRIGSTNSGEYFNGSLDEVRVWNVARTAAQLNGAKGAHLLRNPAGLVAYYRFGEGSGPATADANGVAANAGTLMGGAGWTTDAPVIVNGVPVVLTVTDASGHPATASAVVLVSPAGPPLPVELVSFTAQPAGPAVRLAWATASERNSLRFEIERSADGQAFDKIGEAAAQGTTTSPTAYAYLDNSPSHSATQSLYYRLRQVDRDGTFAYSPVRALTLSGQPSPGGGLTLVPNPAPGRATTLVGAEAGATVAVFDALGRRVLAATADAAGRAELALPAGLPAGVYVVRSGPRAVRLAVE